MSMRGFIHWKRPSALGPGCSCLNPRLPPAPWAHSRAAASLASGRSDNAQTEAEAEAEAEVWLEGLTNHERLGVPAGAGSGKPGDAAFDLLVMHQLLQALGDPHRLLRVVHISGSKGKGSTAAFLAGILRAAGLAVGVYGSPHVVTVRERVSAEADGSPIPRREWCLLLQRHRGAVEAVAAERRAAGEAEPTWFEVVTALALKHFQEREVDVAVVEVGLGGARDATNVFSSEQLLAAVVLPVGLEHAAALGGSIAAIAQAKAGIFKRGRPAVIAPQPHAEARATLRAEAAALECPEVEVAGLVDVSGGQFVAAEEAGRPWRQRIHLAYPGAAAAAALSLMGPGQPGNAAAAVAAALQLTPAGAGSGAAPPLLPAGLPAAAVEAGLESAALPGRFQVLPGGGAQGLLCTVVDGAHTPEAAAALAQQLRALHPAPAPLALVLAMAEDKDAAGVAAALQACQPCTVVFTSVAIAGGTSRAAAPGRLAGQWQVAEMTRSPDREPGLRCRQLIQVSMLAALERARQELAAQSRPGVLCVTGSLHAAAAALHILEAEGQRPPAPVSTAPQP